MRLIYADALIAECQLAQEQADRNGREYSNAFYSGGGEISTEWWCVEDMIENAPTIEERNTGHWVGCDGEFKTMCKCSECGAMIDINEKYRNFFCYHCGAKMEDVNG